MSINTGGAAFPNSDDQAAHAVGAAAIVNIADPAERDRLYIAARGAAMQGMTLRDYFAAKAMQGIAASSLFVEWKAGEIARCAYQQADAMLAARGAA